MPSVFHHAVVFFDKRHARRTKTPSDGHSFFPRFEKHKAKRAQFDRQRSNAHNQNVSPVFRRKSDRRESTTVILSSLALSSGGRSNVVFNYWYGFEFKGSRAMKPHGPQKAKLRRSVWVDTNKRSHP